ncbi:MAG: acetyl-CoA carboxylase biotin carboxyl carrier protein [Candidatus Omnitrophota bacterium]|jgi:acetyl-CoA carboxylase biotin carboxyl carrier protein|nr:acetyl-CoA carboxylase biotin carboxyl carrier protein [Candidatus Omnitrophota bacterium]
MNLKEIKEIINLMNEHDLNEIEVEREGTKIKIRKNSAEGYEPTRHQPLRYHVETQPSAPALEASTSVNPNAKEIKSPMVGTFYRAPSPEAPIFIEVGQIVEVGQVVCIVEAMKLMNEIKSEVRGKIVEIPVENAQPVEFGQTLFVVEPV